MMENLTLGKGNIIKDIRNLFRLKNVRNSNWNWRHKKPF